MAECEVMSSKLTLRLLIYHCNLPGKLRYLTIFLFQIVTKYYANICYIFQAINQGSSPLSK